MTYEKWDIILVPFPFTDFTSVKKRPALIISPTEFNSGPDIVIMFITSKINSYGRDGDCMINSWKECGLLKSSMTRMKFATIDKSIIKQRLGTLISEDQDKLDQEIRRFFKL